MRIARSSVFATQAAGKRSGVGVIKAGDDLTGIALSGGGIRSAAFSLGVIQALDSLTDHQEPYVLDALDYLSAVSGGGYTGAAVVAGLVQPDYSFPFDSRFDEQETPETQHLRDFSNFLLPNGAIDYLTSGALVLRGLIVNAVVTSPVILLLAVLTVACAPTVLELGQPNVLGSTLPRWLPVVPGLKNFALTVDALFALVALLFASIFVTSATFRRSTLAARNRLGLALGALVFVVATIAWFELQPFVLRGMFAASTVNRSDPPPDKDSGALAGQLLTSFARWLPTLAGVLAPIAVTLIGAAHRLAVIATAAVGEATWTGWIKKRSSQIAIAAAGVLAPLMLWVTYIYLSFWAVRLIDGEPNPASPQWLAGASVKLFHLIAPWVDQFAPEVPAPLGPIGVAYGAVAVAALLACLFIGPNANSLHRLYRDRLSRAFLAARPHGASEPDSADKRKLSDLRIRDEGGQWAPTAALAPYLIVNTAINLEGSRELNKRGRNADVFTFTPLHVGSDATGYVATTAMEQAVPDLTLATAMATSGAAASANMGGNTIKLLTFSLSLLNVRLGYWLANPARLGAFRRQIGRTGAGVGTWFFAKETLGILSEKTLNVYLTDGGHIENLGVYELLKRKAKVVVAVDAECDPDMRFGSLARLEVLARIEFGARIELPWRRIGKPDAPRGSPHAAIGRIRYGETESGVLIYLKASVTGDEPDYVLDYRRRFKAFPQETTIDQFFTEEQFEAYRALGFHVARRLFDGSDPVAALSPAPPGWRRDVERALALLNVPANLAGPVMMRVDEGSRVP